MPAIVRAIGGGANRRCRRGVDLLVTAFLGILHNTMCDDLAGARCRRGASVRPSRSRAVKDGTATGSRSNRIVGVGPELACALAIGALSPREYQTAAATIVPRTAVPNAGQNRFFIRTSGGRPGEARPRPIGLSDVRNVTRV